MFLFLRDLRIIALLLRDQPLSLERGHTTGSSRSDRLSVFLILNIASSENTLNGRLGRSGDSNDVTIRVSEELVSDERGSGLVTDGVEETVNGEVGDFVRLDVLNLQVLEQVTVSFTSRCDGLQREESVSRKKDLRGTGRGGLQGQSTVRVGL